MYKFFYYSFFFKRHYQLDFLYFVTLLSLIFFFKISSEIICKTMVTIIEKLNIVSKLSKNVYKRTNRLSKDIITYGNKIFVIFFLSYLILYLSYVFFKI